MIKESKNYRKSVGIMLINNENLIFIGKRRYSSSLIKKSETLWQMPQGGIDEGETPKQAAIRELDEEIGTKNVEILKEHTAWLNYDLPNELRKKSWKGQYLGQTQKWFLMRFLGTDTEINLETTHPEFCEWKWAQKEEVLNLVIDFKKDVYKQVINDFLNDI